MSNMIRVGLHRGSERREVHARHRTVAGTGGHWRGGTRTMIVMLADDHPTFRRGLRALLETESDIQVIAEARDGRETLDMVERLEPDVLVLDMVLPGLDGAEVTRRIRSRGLRTQVLILSAYADEAYVISALRNGAAGYILKVMDEGRLVEAVRAVAAGERYLSPSLRERGLEAWAEGDEDAPEAPYDALTDREREVLHMVAEGMSNREIAERLHISRRTVETHRLHTMRKLGLKTHCELIRFALRRGIVRTDD